MPPKVRIQKETITRAAYDLVRESGAKQLNARNLAQAAGCSTQPIFSSYKSMDEVLADVKQMARDEMNRMLANAKKGDLPMLGIGETYIRYAGLEPHLFELLYCNGEQNEIFKMITAEGMIRAVSLDGGISESYAEELLRNFFFYCHGIAVSRANQSVDALPAAGELKGVLKDFYKSYRKLYKKREE